VKQNGVQSVVWKNHYKNSIEGMTGKTILEVGVKDVM
jgi:hypothetical protein